MDRRRRSARILRNCGDLATTPVSIDRFFNFEQEIQGFELNLQKALDGFGGSHQLGFGLEYRDRETTEFRDGLSTDMNDGTSTNVILGEAFPLRDFPISETTEWGAYFEDVFSRGDWSLIAAIRADRYELSTFAYQGGGRRLGFSVYGARIDNRVGYLPEARIDIQAQP